MDVKGTRAEMGSSPISMEQEQFAEPVLPRSIGPDVLGWLATRSECESSIEDLREWYRGSGLKEDIRAEPLWKSLEELIMLDCVAMDELSIQLTDDLKSIASDLNLR